MRFTYVVATLALCASSALASSSNLAQDIGTVPAFLQLQQKHFNGQLSHDEQTEFVALGQKIHKTKPTSLTALTGTSNEAQQLVSDLIQGVLAPFKKLEDSVGLGKREENGQDKVASQIDLQEARDESSLEEDPTVFAEPVPKHKREHDGDEQSEEPKSVGHVPYFIHLAQEASHPDASNPVEEEKLIKQGLAMLSSGYTKGSLKSLLGTHQRGQELLSKILHAKSSHAPQVRNMKPSRAHLNQRRALLH